MTMTRSIFIITLFCALSVQAVAGPVDSVGTVVKKGKLFILHKVDKGQGLYAISRRYNVKVDDILSANPGASKDLVLNQELLIPTGKKAPMEQKVVKDYFKKDKSSESVETNENTRGTFAKYHTVKKGETLFAISRMYNTKVDVIKSLNDLESNELKEGQKLLVPMTKAEEKAIEKHETTGEDKVERKKEISNEGSAGEAEVQFGEESEVVEVSEISGKYESRTDYIEEFDMQKTWERGVAQVGGSGAVNTSKRVASHHAAEIGTTIMVTNPVNNDAVFVKVVAHHKLDKNKANVIILSNSAASHIELENGAAVEISFAK